ncbi:MAG: hypothetical protein ACYC08_05090, partial [Armatimonadota bacterium]
RWMPIVPTRGQYIPPPIVRPNRSYTTRTVPAPVPETKVIVGQVIEVFPYSENPRIVILTGGRTFTYIVPNTAIILRGPLGGAYAEVPVGYLQAGDKVTMLFDERGKPTSIRAQYRRIQGTVASIEDGMIVLESGITLKPSPETLIVLPDNTLGELSDIHAGDTIQASASPLTGQITVIALPPASRPDPVTLNSTGPFQEEDVLTLTVQGKPDGKGTFTVPGVKENISLTEIRPGVYQGEYIVQPGDELYNVPVTATIDYADKSSLSLASRPVTIKTIPGYLPRIISPHQGSEIASPIAVQGIGEPGSTVRVTVRFTANLQGILPIQGTTDITEVRVGPDGTWSTEPLSTVTPFYEDRTTLPADFGIFSGAFPPPPYLPIRYIITATELGPEGGRASYSVELTRSSVREAGI